MRILSQALSKGWDRLFRRVLEPMLKRTLRRLFKLQVEGLERIDGAKPYLVMPNHVSLWDALLLGMVLPKEVHFVVNAQMARKFNWIVRQRSYIAVDPSNPYSVRTMVNTVRSGKPLVIFPEGRITVTGGLMKIYDGSGYIALKTGAPIYPVAVNGLERSKLSYLNRLHKTVWFPKVGITVGTPFKVTPDVKAPMRNKKRQASSQILRALQELLISTRTEQDDNLFNRLLDAEQTNGKQSVIARDLNQELTYKQLVLGSRILGDRLVRLLPNRERIALFLPNSGGLLVTLFALFKNGQTPVLLHFSAGRQTLLDALETAGCAAVLTSRTFVEKGKFETVIHSLGERAKIVYLEDVRASIGRWDKLRGWVDDWKKRRSPCIRDNELVLFTSGSENKPKGVVLSHAGLYANIQQVRAMIDVTQRDQVFNALPMFHSFGLTVGTLLPVLTGAKVFLYPTPLHYKAIPELVYDWKATVVFGTSTFLAHYGKHAHPYDFFSIRYAAAGAERLRPEVRQLWQEKFGIRLLEGYGITETSPVLAFNSPLMHRTGTVGPFAPGINWRIEDVEGIERGGNLFVQGPNLMKGYLIQGKGFVPCEEWYDTGDIVEVSPDGFVTILARRKRFAKIAGEMVSLAEVEQLAEQVYGAGRFAAVSLPDGRKGEKIVLAAAGRGLKREAFRDFLAQNGHSPLKLPAELREVEALPLLGSGKTDYPELKRRLEKD